MIPRYTRDAMGRIWTDANRFRIWMEIELSAAEAMEAAGMIPAGVGAALRAKAWVPDEKDVAAIAAIEAERQHDVIAFLTHLERRMGPEARYLHMGMTSSDVLDSCLGAQLDESAGLILEGLDALRGAVSKQAQKHKRTLMVGRTHGIHAEPITFGLVLALWYAELDRQRVRIEAARKSVAVGKLSGAVGTFAHLPPEIEASVCAKLGLTPEPIANQVVQRDRHAEWFAALANLGASIEKMAVNLRHMQRTEVGEAAEAFGKGQRGSSAMPHKKNPIASENLTGVARLLRSHASAAFENVALWHERDISHSSVERVIAPDACILTDYALARMTRLIEGLVVDEARMRANLDMSRGLVFSQRVLLALVQAGVEREAAYGWVQRNALACWEQGGAFLDRLLADEEIRAVMDEASLRSCFDFGDLFDGVEQLFGRVFG